LRRILRAERREARHRGADEKGGGEEAAHENLSG